MSFPGPATYFDVNGFLPDLLSPPKIEFKLKLKTPIVWIVSNCHAFNNRESFVQRLINHIDVDSYGQCLNNKPGEKSGKMQGKLICIKIFQNHFNLYFYEFLKEISKFTVNTNL